MALTYIDDYIRENSKKSRIIATVHDSICLDCPPDEVTEMAKVVKFIMENLPIDFLFIKWNGEKIRYPIKSEVEIGVTYNDLVEFDGEEYNNFRSTHGYTKYHLDLERFDDYANNGMITKEQAEQGKQQIEDAKENYEKI